MKVLYAPWRSGYSDSVDQTKHETADESDCVFCHQFSENADDKYFIIKRFSRTVVMLNRYPYNAGHLLIMPLEHKGLIDELKAETQCELMWLMGKSSSILKSTLGAQGINIGINMGKIAGAGIPAHVHVHVLPRWSGDTNFLPTLCETKVVSYDLHEVFEKLKKAFDNLDKKS